MRVDCVKKDVASYKSLIPALVFRMGTLDGTNRLEDAVRFNGAAQTLFESSNYPMVSFDLAEFKRHIRIAEKQLGGTRFEELVSGGYEMTMEQAIAYALEDERN